MQQNKVQQATKVKLNTVKSMDNYEESTSDSNKTEDNRSEQSDEWVSISRSTPKREKSEEKGQTKEENADDNDGWVSVITPQQRRQNIQQEIEEQKLKNKNKNNKQKKIAEIKTANIKNIDQTFDKLKEEKQKIKSSWGVKSENDIQKEAEFVKQATEADSIREKQNPEVFECGVCLCNENLKTINKCGHQFCGQCIRGCMEYQMKKRSTHEEVFKCPDETCCEKIDFLLYAELYRVDFVLDKLLSFQCYMDKEMPDFFDQYRVMICARPNCNKVFTYNKYQKKELVCRKCRVSYDPQTQLMKSKFNEKEIHQMANLRLLGMMRCPACAFWVERTEGCNDMICNCGFNFCYDCGQNMRRNHYYCGKNPDLIQQLVLLEAEKIAKNLEESDSRYSQYKSIQERNKYMQERFDFRNNRRSRNNDW